MRKKRVFVPLVGGLGNQLFALGFAKSLQAKGFHPTLYNAGIAAQQSLHPKKSGVLGGLTSMQLGVDVSGPLSSFFLNSIAKLLSGLNKIGFLATRRLLQDRDVSTDANLDGVSLFTRGYFQSPCVYLDNKDFFQNLISDYFKLDAKSGFIISPSSAIHVRRGDYLKNLDSFGALSADYFAKVAERISRLDPKENYQIVSDGEVSEIIDYLSRRGQSAIEKPETLGWPPIRILVFLASSKKHLVLSNSSLSWWAGALNETAQVWYPTPWFKGKDHSLEPLPAWIVNTSEWM